MTEQATANVVRHSVTVPISAERAFRLFTEEIGTWWPQDTHKLSEGAITEVFEGREGGRWYELAEDGSECTVATMVVWEPPARFVMAWQLTPQWQFEPDLDRATQVEVTFEPEAGTATRVTLEHRGFESYGEPGENMRKEVGGKEGWLVIIERYAEVARR
jgi:Activator of Hsp90 ATPase homolog 1-like protein